MRPGPGASSVPGDARVPRIGDQVADDVPSIRLPDEHALMVGAPDEERSHRQRPAAT